MMFSIPEIIGNSDYPMAQVKTKDAMPVDSMQLSAGVHLLLAVVTSKPVLLFTAHSRRF
jgi:hypothetical protein